MCVKKYTRVCPRCNKTVYHKSKESLNNALREQCLCKSCGQKTSKNKRKSDCSFLEKRTLLFFYWLGFILADGHISKNRLSVVLDIKDENHLKKLAKLLKTKIKRLKSNGHNQCKISVMDTDVISSLVREFGIKSNKTESPPDISNIKNNDLKALSIGFIDGDGYIKKLYKRNDFSITVKCHRNWLNNLKQMFINQNCYINNFGYAQVTISNTVESKKLKNFALDNKLPVLERKWDIIDLNFIGRNEKSSKRIDTVSEMLLKNKSRKEIKKATGLTDSGLSTLINKNKLK